MKTLSLGVLAHVDAGKTSLSERLLYEAGAIDSMGSVDDGSTQTDSLALERKRGFTIKSAVVSFVAHGSHDELLATVPAYRRLMEAFEHDRAEQPRAPHERVGSAVRAHRR